MDEKIIKVPAGIGDVKISIPYSPPVIQETGEGTFIIKSGGSRCKLKFLGYLEFSTEGDLKNFPIPVFGTFPQLQRCCFEDGSDIIPFVWRDQAWERVAVDVVEFDRQTGAVKLFLAGDLGVTFRLYYGSFLCGKVSSMLHYRTVETECNYYHLSHWKEKFWFKYAPASWKFKDSLAAGRLYPSTEYVFGSQYWDVFENCAVHRYFFDTLEITHGIRYQGRPMFSSNTLATGSITDKIPANISWWMRKLYDSYSSQFYGIFSLYDSGFYCPIAEDSVKIFCDMLDLADEKLPTVVPGPKGSGSLFSFVLQTGRAQLIAYNMPIGSYINSDRIVIDDTWRHYQIVFQNYEPEADAYIYYLYVNDLLCGQFTIPKSYVDNYQFFDTNFTWIFGGATFTMGPADMQTALFSGLMEEIRIDYTFRPLHWRHKEYESTNNPEAFTTLEGEVSYEAYTSVS